MRTGKPDPERGFAVMDNTRDRIHALVEAQRKTFRSGVTLDIGWRLEQLKKLKQAVLDREEILESALQEDLGRSRTEAYLCDIGPILVEINEILRGLRKWAKPEKHFSGLMCFPSTRTTVYKMPYGVKILRPTGFFKWIRFRAGDGQWAVPGAPVGPPPFIPYPRKSADLGEVSFIFSEVPPFRLLFGRGGLY